MRIVDGTGSPVVAGQSLLVVDGKIARLGPAADLKAERADVVIDGRGRTVMPGLVMLHEHLLFLDPTSDPVAYVSEPLASPRAYLAYGATTIRTTGTFSGSDDLLVARGIRAGTIVGPEIFVTAPFLDGAGSFALQMRPVTDAASARRIVDFWADEGATSYKIYMNVSREVLAAAIDAAHKRGLKVTGHLCSITFHEAAALGIDQLEHGVVVATDFVVDKKPDQCPDPPDGRGCADRARVRRAGNARADRDARPPACRRHVHARCLCRRRRRLVPGDRGPFVSEREVAVLGPAHAGDALSESPSGAGVPRSCSTPEMRFERAFVAAGGTLVAGTDPTGWGGTLPGPGNHAELRLLAAAGFPPLEVIRIATSEGARVLGIDGRVGSLRPGLQADLLLVDGRPDEDIAQIGKLDLVFRDGIAYDPARLRESVRGKIGR